MTATLTVENLKARKSYIIAKIAKLGLEDQTKAFMETMLHSVECGFDGDLYKLVMEVYFQLRVRSRKTNRVAESRAKLADVTGIEQASFAEIKFGKQHFIKM